MDSDAKKGFTVSGRKLRFRSAEDMPGRLRYIAVIGDDEACILARARSRASDIIAEIEAVHAATDAVLISRTYGKNPRYIVLEALSEPEPWQEYSAA